MNNEYKKIKELRKKGYSYREIGEALNVSRRDITKIAKITSFSKEGKRRYYQKVTGIIKPIKKQKQFLTPAKVRIIGNLLFDGSVFKSKGYHYSIMYINSSEELVKRFCKDFKKVYNVQASIFEVKEKTKLYRAKYNSKLIYIDLLNYIKSYSTSNKFAEIPKEIRNGPKKLKIEFLRTFWDNEGSISKESRIRGSSNSFRVINQLNRIHEELGFETNIYKDKRNLNINYILSLNKNIRNLKKFYKYKLFTDYSLITRGVFNGMKKMDILKYFLEKYKRQDLKTLKL